MAQSKSVVLPLVLSSVAHAFGVRLGASGYIASFELGAVTLTILLASYFIGRWGPRKTALAGALATTAGNLMSAMAPSLSLLVAARIIVGLGEGAMFAAVFAAASSLALPERIYAMMQGWAMAIAVIMSLVLPWLIVWAGYPGAFVTIALLAAAMIPLCYALPTAVHSVAPSAAPNISSVLSPAALVALVAVALMAMGIHGVWFNASLRGDEIGLTPQAIGLSILAGQAFGAAGTVAAAKMAVTWGRKSLFYAGAILCAAAIVLGGLRSVVPFYAAMGLIPLGFAVTMAYHAGLLARLDVSGRLAALAPVFWTGGAALGPVLLGVATELGDYILFSTVSIAAILLSMLLVSKWAAGAKQSHVS